MAGNDISRELAQFSLSKGAMAGAIATIPMTLFMLGMHRLLPKWEQYALPPEQITDEAAERVNIELNKPESVGAALVAHLGYGASMGTLYGTFARRLPLPLALSGPLYALVVWAGSYLGWLPALRFTEAAPRETPRRNALMIVAHLIWGTVLGLVLDRLEM